jgi:ABC-type transporter Mla subunit MlaD
MRRLAAIFSLLAACVAAVVLTTGASDDQAKGKTFLVAFDNAFGLVEGGDVKIGGVKAGQTAGFDITRGAACTPTKPPPERENFEVTPNSRWCAVAELKMNQPGFDTLRTDAECRVAPQSLIGEYYVDCQSGTAKKPDGSPDYLGSATLEDLPKRTETVHAGTIKDLEEGKNPPILPVKQTASTIPVDLVNNVLRRPYRERLRLILTELGTGLAGRPQDINDTIHRAVPALRETDKVLEILGDQNKILEDFVVDSDTVVVELERKKDEVARWIREAGGAAETTASRRDALAEQFRKLPGFLAELEPTMVRLGELADEQTPLLRDLQRAAPDLQVFLERLGPFSEASRPAVRSLGDLGNTGRSAFNESRDEVAELRRLASDAPKFGRPLRQFLQTIDTRARTVKPDIRAEQTAPPRPDPTADVKGKGFTGIEGLLNYFYYQTLSVNVFDEISHSLNVVGFENAECGDYNANPTEQQIEHCAAWLGPNQPGVTARDFPASSKARRATPAKSRNERRGPGEREALPFPGDQDPSQPDPTLPPSLEGILGDKSTNAVPDQALDYLLAP